MRRTLRLLTAIAVALIVLVAGTASANAAMPTAIEYASCCVVAVERHQLPIGQCSTETSLIGKSRDIRGGQAGADADCGCGDEAVSPLQSDTSLGELPPPGTSTDPFGYAERR